MPSIFIGLLTTTAVAAVAVSIPIIIHLLNRRRYRVVTWAAMRFLFEAQKKNTRRMRLEQLILLAVRALALLLLVLAMAGVSPWAEDIWRRLFPAKTVYALTGQQRTHKIIVIDGSLSMGARVGDQTSFEKARALAQQLVKDSPAGDGFNVILMAAPPRRIVPETSENSGKVADEIGALRLPHGNADLAATLLAVEDLLRQSPTKYPEREVYFLTDLQRTTWDAPPGTNLAEIVQRVQARSRMVLVDVGQDNVNNVAVTNLTIGAPIVTTRAATPLAVTVRNYGTEERDARLDLLVGKAREKQNDPPFELRLVDQQKIVVPAGQSVTVPFQHRFGAAGEYLLQVRLDNDALDLDDVRTVAVSVKDTVPVMLVNGKPVPEVLDRATEWLKTALNPFVEGLVPSHVPARPEVVSEATFQDPGLGDLTRFDCVFLCDVASLRASDVQRLEAHLRRGGGVVFCLGPTVKVDAYNQLLYKQGEGILPAKLIGRQDGLANRAFTFHGADEAYKRAPLDAFAGDDDKASLMSARFRSYMRVEVPTRGQARKVLSFVPEPVRGGKPASGGKELPSGDAAVVEWTRYRGRVVLLATAVNMDWSAWPIYPSYAAFMQELLRFAVAGRLREHATLVGQPLEEYLPAGNAGFDVALVPPDGKKVETQTQPFQEAAMLQWAETDLSGVYRATIGQHPQEYLFAVNVPVATDAQTACESDLTRTNKTELQAAFPTWDFQIVTGLKQIDHTTGSSPGEARLIATTPDPSARGVGTYIAHVLLILMFLLLLAEPALALWFGHHSAVAGQVEQAPSRGWLLPSLTAVASMTVIAILGFVLIHGFWTGDFFSFWPDSDFRLTKNAGSLILPGRNTLQQSMGGPPSVAGETTHWRPDFRSYLTGRRAVDPWLVGGLVLVAFVLVAAVHFMQALAGGVAKKSAGALVRDAVRYFCLIAFRFQILLIALVVLLPQIGIAFEKRSQPDLVILIDDSRSMSTVDRYPDAEVQEAASRLAQETGLSRPERLQLAQALIARQDGKWLLELMSKRKVKVHIYHCSSRAAKIGSFTEPADRDATLKGINALKAEGETSQLGTAVRQVLNDYRGSSLAAVVMLTDGVTTEGEDLGKVSKYAAQMGVPLFFVGIGDTQDQRDLQLHDLQVEDQVYVRDRVVFEGRLTGQGYTDLRVPVRLYEKGKDGNLKELARDTITVDAFGKPVKFRLTHQPTEAGEKVYVLDVPEQADEVDTSNNRLQRTVQVREAKPIRVLYVEGYPRYEFRFIKTLLERELEEEQGKKSIELQVLLLDADDDFPVQDKTARADFPATKEDLNQYQVIILGDVDPNHEKLREKNLQNLADFVRERGGGLLVIAGPQFSPHAFAKTPLASVLPIKPLAKASRLVEPASESFRPTLTPVGRLHPIFRFAPDEAENATIWNRLAEMYWWSDAYLTQPAAEVLAVHPRLKADAGERRLEGGEERHPLIVQHFVGSGRCLFLGLEETWRWRFREDEIHFNQFWLQLVKYLSRSRLGRTDLRLDRQTPYRRGEPIRITARFPEDAPAPDPATEVKVVAERRPLRPSGQPDPGAAEVEVQTIKLAKLDGSRATYEAVLNRSPEGDYRFWLSSPSVSGTRPRAECKVLPPPGELERIRMNQAEMESAAEATRGQFFNLVTFDKLIDALPMGTRVSLSVPYPPWLFWNLWPILFFLLSLATAEWILRKRMNLL